MAEQLFDGEFFAGLRLLRLAFRCKRTSGRNGGRRSLAKGTSVEFADFREYLLGDDIRRIDWNAYGRLGKLFIKQYMQEQEGMYTILLDGSSSMSFGKEKSAQQIAGALGHMALNSMDRVRFCVLQEEQKPIGKSYIGVQSINRFLNQIQQTIFQGKTDLPSSVMRIPYQGRGVTILISDFFDQAVSRSSLAALQETVRYLRYQKQEVLLVHILSQEERAPHLEGTIELLDGETEERLQITASARLEKEYVKALQGFTIQLEKICHQYQASYLRVSSEEPVAVFLQRAMQKGQLERI